MFNHIHFDTIPATNLERARDFYRDKLDFVVERDEPYAESGGRWIFMQIPGSPTLLHFDHAETIAPSQTPALVLATDDVDEACETLMARGVNIDNGPADAPWAPGTRWAMIHDSEGNLVLIQTIPRE